MMEEGTSPPPLLCGFLVFVDISKTGNHQPRRHFLVCVVVSHKEVGTVYTVVQERRKPPLDGGFCAQHQPPKERGRRPLGRARSKLGGGRGGGWRTCLAGTRARSFQERVKNVCCLQKIVEMPQCRHLFDSRQRFTVWVSSTTTTSHNNSNNNIKCGESASNQHERPIVFFANTPAPKPPET